MTRSCEGCTKCCEGWLWGEAHGHHFWSGRPCHYKTENGCSIYENRPENPCKTYRCQWLDDDRIPAWMKPNKINAIITLRKIGDIFYFDIMEAGSKLDSTVLSWFFIEYANGRIANLRYQVEGGHCLVGTAEFLQKMRGN